ncbi:MAG: hypothetical protein Q9M32_04690 [Sulfurimonas sp.]|nr:hypothetical protein [Sulfurimonas sp.]MDQ7060162.1 hypothetical protein [Sulfurimonas sp.]
MTLICKIFTLLLFTVSFANASKNLAVLYTFDTPNDEAFYTFLEDDLKDIGFFLNDPHHRVNDAYEQHFGSTDLSLIGFSSIMNESVVRPLLNKDPRLAAFSPFNLLNYRKKSDMKTIIAHLTPEAILDILEIDDEEIREEYIASFVPLDRLIHGVLGGKKSHLPLNSFAKKRIINYEIVFDEPEDIDDFLDAFQENFEEAFEMKDFVITGFYNIKKSVNDEEDVMPEYESFWSYDLCHIPFTYAILDGENARPEAGVFAPCSMYIYKRKGENKLVIGMPTLATWEHSLAISDYKQLEYIDKLDKEIEEILKSLGGIEVEKGNPLVKEIPK